MSWKERAVIGVILFGLVAGGTFIADSAQHGWLFILTAGPVVITIFTTLMNLRLLRNQDASAKDGDVRKSFELFLKAIVAYVIAAYVVNFASASLGDPIYLIAGVAAIAEWMFAVEATILWTSNRYPIMKIFKKDDLPEDRA